MFSSSEILSENPANQLDQQVKGRLATGILRQLKMTRFDVNKVCCDELDIKIALRDIIVAPRDVCYSGTYILSPVDLNNHHLEASLFTVLTSEHIEANAKIRLLIPLTHDIHWFLAIVDIQHYQITKANLWTPVSQIPEPIFLGMQAAIDETLHRYSTWQIGESLLVDDYEYKYYQSTRTLSKVDVEILAADIHLNTWHEGDCVFLQALKYFKQRNLPSRLFALRAINPINTINLRAALINQIIHNAADQIEIKPSSPDFSLPDFLLTTPSLMIEKILQTPSESDQYLREKLFYWVLRQKCNDRPTLENEDKELNSYLMDLSHFSPSEVLSTIFNKVIETCPIEKQSLSVAELGQLQTLLADLAALKAGNHFAQLSALLDNIVYARLMGKYRIEFIFDQTIRQALDWAHQYASLFQDNLYQSIDGINQKFAHSSLFINNLIKLKNYTLLESNNQNLAVSKATELAETTKDLITSLNTHDPSEIGYRLLHFNDLIEELELTSWPWKMILGALIGAVVGFILGLLIGMALGPGIVATVTLATIYGASVGTGSIVGGVVGRKIGFWQERSSSPNLVNAGKVVIEDIKQLVPQLNDRF